MAFSVTVPAADPSDGDAIANGSFFPAIDPVAIRDAQRIDSTITAGRLRDALIEAMASVNADLADWRDTQIAAGKTTLSATNATEIDGASVNVHRYRRAVGCQAKAALLERYRDFDSAARGDRKAEALADPIDDLRRDAAWAISDIRGVRRTTVELI